MSIGKLICLAHAGGSASSYLRWSSRFDSSLKLVPLEYAGRGIRSNEPLYENMDETVADLIQMLKPQLADRIPYVLFGHSLGALVAYELAYALQQARLLGPSILILSGKNPPHLHSRNKRHLLPDAEFHQELASMGGTPSELLEDSSFAEYFMPIARSDFKLVETYRLEAGRPKLHTNICVLNGMEDDFVDLKEMEGWGRYCEGEFWQQQFPGGHFYLHEHIEQVAVYLKRLLAQSSAWQPQI